MVDAPNFETKIRPQYQKLRSLLLARSAWVLKHPLLTVAKRIQKTGPMVHRPYPLVDVIVKAAYSPQFFLNPEYQSDLGLELSTFCTTGRRTIT